MKTEVGGHALRVRVVSDLFDGHVVAAQRLRAGQQLLAQTCGNVLPPGIRMDGAQCQFGGAGACVTKQRGVSAYLPVDLGDQRVPALVGVVLVDHLRQINVRLHIKIAVHLAEQLADRRGIAGAIITQNQRFHPDPPDPCVHNDAGPAPAGICLSGDVVADPHACSTGCAVPANDPPVIA